jgi:putative ABC transport system permease protein
MSIGTSKPGGSKPGKRVAMAPKLAYRNLFHDKLSLIVTLVGIVFSVVLVAVQCGLYIGSERMIAAMPDHTRADLWIVPLGSRSFDDPVFLNGRERHAALSTAGVATVEDLVVGLGAWRKPDGGTTAVLLVGSQYESEGLQPWDIIEGSPQAVTAPAGVAVDKTYFGDLGITTASGLEARAEINNQKVVVQAVTDNIRSFTTMPYVFTTSARARQLLDAAPEQASFVLVRVAPGADIKTVRAELARRLQNVEVLSHAEFRARGVNYWLFQTGAGGALIAGALLGMIVGIVIVTQTLYSSTKDHLNEFATLRALGASAGYIHEVILLQALLSGVIGYIAGMTLSLLIIWASQGSTLFIVMTPTLALMLLILTLGMCVIAALSAIMKVTRIDPAGVFSR